MDCNLIWLKIWVNFVWTSGQRLLRRGHPAEKYARGLVFFFCFFFAFYWVYFLVFPFHSFNFFSWLSSFTWPVCIEEKTYDGNSRAMLKTWNVNCIFNVWICFITHGTQTYMIWQKLRNIVFYNQLISCSSISVILYYCNLYSGRSSHTT